MKDSVRVSSPDVMEMLDDACFGGASEHGIVPAQVHSAKVRRGGTLGWVPTLYYLTLPVRRRMQARHSFPNSPGFALTLAGERHRQERDTGRRETPAGEMGFTHDY